MDLSKIDVATKADAGVEINLFHPVTRADLFAPGSDGKDDTTRPMTVTVRGEHSEVYVKQSNLTTDRRLKAKGKLNLTAEELEAEELAKLTACVVGWKNLVIGGVEVPYSPAKARELLADRRFAWLRKQVDEAVHDEARFI